MTRRRFDVTVLAALLLLSGCLPYSCRREESSALVPADSLSRELAASVDVDTLALDWTCTGGEAAAFEYPRTVRFGPASSDTIYVGDAEQGLLFVLDTSGRVIDTVETVDVPYVAGVRGDTVGIFDPDGPAVHLLIGGERVGTVPIRDDDRPRTALVYGAFDGNVYYKRVDADAASFVAKVDRDGTLRSRHALSGPQWRHAGLLRLWGDSVLSLSGFRPVVDVVTRDGTVDTLALRGFDSPMLARSRAFMMGDVHQAPLLTSSAAPAGDLLFVLNMRAGWLHVDVFDRSGLLVRRLTERDAAYRGTYFPQDLDVRRRPDGSYALAVVFTQPDPSVRLYTWTP